LILANIIIAIILMLLIAFQWFVLVWPLTGQPLNINDEKTLAIMEGVFWVHPVWGVICLLNFIWPLWLGASRYWWIIATFIPILLMLFCMKVVPSILKKFNTDS